MRKLLSLAVLLVCFTSTAQAQETDSRGELLVGRDIAGAVPTAAGSSVSTAYRVNESERRMQSS